jgi:hypothetical protein
VVEVTHVRLTDDNAAHMRSATVDDELRRLWPDAERLLSEIDAHYPKQTVVFREIVPLDGGAPVRVPIAELLAESASRR